MPLTIRDIAIRFGYEVDQNSERRVENGIKGIKNLASSLLGAIGIVFTIKGLTELVEAAADAEALKSQFSQVFGDMESEASDKLSAIADSTGVMADRMKSSFTQIAAFAKTTGMDSASALEISDRAMKAVTDSAAFYDRSIEEVTESMKSLLKGNFAVDASLGLSITETTRNAAANKLFAKSYNELSESQKQLTLLGMVEDANKTSGALGQAARESDTWTNQLGNLKQSLQNLKATAGKGLLQPAIIILKMLAKGVQFLTKQIENLTSENGLLTRTFERINAIVKVLKPSFDRFTSSLSKGFQRSKDFIKSFADKFGGIGNLMKLIGIIAAAVITAISFKGIIQGAKTLAIVLGNMVKVFTSIGVQGMIIIGVIVAIGLVIEDLINFMSGNDSVIGALFESAGISAEDGRNMIINAWNNVIGFLETVWNILSKGVGMFIDTVKNFIDKHSSEIIGMFLRAWNIISDFLQGIWTFISSLATTIFGKSSDNINSSQEDTEDSVLSVWQNILNVLTSIFDALFAISSSVFNSVASVIETIFSEIETFWNSWGTRILSSCKNLWDGLGGIINGFLDIIKGLADFITAVFTGNWQGAWEAIAQIFIGVWEVISNFLNMAWENIKLIFELALSALVTMWNANWQALSNFFMSTWNAIVSFITSVLNSISEFISSTFSNILSGVTNTVGNIKNAIVNGFNAATDFIKNLPSQALQWGKDFMDGLVNGIKQGITGVVDAVKGVGEKIKSYLHFSVPDQGPLTDYETWMPDFMGGLAKGIKLSRGSVINEIKSLVYDMSSLAGLGSASLSTAANSRTSNTSTSIIQNVDINNSYNGGSIDTQRNISRAMKKSATDATTQMARGLAYSRG